MQDCLKIAEFRLFGEGANCDRTHVSPHNNLRFCSHSSLVLAVLASFPVWKDSGNFAEKAKFIFYE